MFKFIHAADLHIDSPLRGLDRYEGCPAEKIRGASRRAVENLVELAIAEKVAFVALAGDIYDGEWTDHNTGLWFVVQMAKLNEAGIPVVCIKGNHDAESKIPSHLHLPPNVRELSSRKPETFHLEDCGVAVHGQGFRTAKITDNLADAYPASVRGWFNLGLLHTCADGREGHDRYSPCSVETMRSKRFEYDYWALGHIHKREVLHESHPHIAFPGNVQGRHIRESGAKGCLLVTVKGDGEAAPEFRALDVFRWRECRIDATGLTDEDELLDRLGRSLREVVETSDGRAAAVRVEFVGGTPLHSKLNARRTSLDFRTRGKAAELPGESVWIEKVVVRTTPPAESAENGFAPGSVGELLELIREVRGDLPRLRGWVEAETADLRKKLEQEIAEPEAFLGLTDDRSLADLLDAVEAQMLDKLAGHGAAAVP